MDIQELIPKVIKERIRKPLAALTESKSPAADQPHPQALNEFIDVVTQPLFMTYERLWRLGLPIKD